MSKKSKHAKAAPSGNVPRKRKKKKKYTPGQGFSMDDYREEKETFGKAAKEYERRYLQGAEKVFIKGRGWVLWDDLSDEERQKRAE